MKSVFTLIISSLILAACSTTAPVVTAQTDSSSHLVQAEDRNEGFKESNRLRIQNEIFNIDSQLTTIESQLVKSQNEASAELASDPTTQSQKYQMFQAQLAHLQNQKSALNDQKLSLQSQLHQFQ